MARLALCWSPSQVPGVLATIRLPLTDRSVAPLFANAATFRFQLSFSKVQINLLREKMEEEEYAEAFQHYSRGGKLGPHELRELMKYLGYNPSDSEIRNMMKRGGSAGSGIESGGVDYNDFVRIMRDQVNNLEADEHLIQCFRVLDRVDNGYVSAAEFKHLMTYVW